MRKILFLVSLNVLICTGVVYAHILIRTDEKYLYIQSDGIPHEHGAFPNAHNPNTISEQEYNFKVALHPKMAAKNTPVERRQLFGVAVDGVPFDPGTAEFWNNDPSSGWNYDALSGAVNLGMDDNNAHVQPNGAYHYHGIPTALASASASKEHSPLVGYAADGFPVYALNGYAKAGDPASGIRALHSAFKLKKGTRPSGPGGRYDGSFVQDYEYQKGGGDLDECNGRSGVTPEYPDGTYYYVLTREFPFVPRCLKGVTDESFIKEHEHRAPGMGGPDGKQSGMHEHGKEGQMKEGHRRTPPPEALSACQGKSQGDDCSFEAPMGEITGQCRKVPEGQMACVPAGGPGR